MLHEQYYVEKAKVDRLIERTARRISIMEFMRDMSFPC